MRSPKPACLHHVSGFIVLRHCTALFLAQVCMHRLASVSRLLTVLARAISWLSIEVVGDCFIFLPRGIALQPARVVSFPAAVTRHAKNTQRPEPGVCGCGPCFCGEPSASQGQWSETAQRRLRLPLQPCFGFVIGVGTYMILCCTHRAVLRAIVAAAEQIKPLPEEFRVSRQLLSFVFGTARSRDSGTMTDTSRRYLARGEGKFTRNRCAGAPRNTGFGCMRTDERCATSVGCSDRISVCRETVRTQSLSQRLAAQEVRQDCTSLVILTKISAAYASWKLYPVPRGFIRPASYGRLPHAAPLLRTAVWGEKRNGVSVMSTRSLIRKRCACSLTSRPCRSTCEINNSSKPAQKRILTRGVQSGSGCGNNECGVPRDFSRRRTRGRAPAAGRPCPGGTHSLHPPRTSRIDHGGAQDESSGRSDDSSRG